MSLLKAGFFEPLKAGFFWADKVFWAYRVETLGLALLGLIGFRVYRGFGV